MKASDFIEKYYSDKEFKNKISKKAKNKKSKYNEDLTEHVEKISQMHKSMLLNSLKDNIIPIKKEIYL